MKGLRLILLVTATAILLNGCRASVTGMGDHGRDQCVLDLMVTDWDARPLTGQWSAPSDLMEHIGADDGHRSLMIRLRTEGDPSERRFPSSIKPWETTAQGFRLSTATGTAEFIVTTSQTRTLLGQFTLDAAQLAGRYDGIIGEPDGPTLLRLTLRAVDAAYLDALADPDAPLTWAQVDRLHSRSVPPDYVHAIRQARSTPATPPAAAVSEPLPPPGPLPVFTADDIVYLSTRGVPAEYIQALQEAGYRLDAKEIYDLRIHGITAAYAAAWRDAGYPLSPEELYYLRIRGIEASYATGLREAGQDLSPEQLYYMKIRGLTAKYVGGFHEIGYDLTPEQLYYLKVRGVTPEYAAAMTDPGHELLTPEQLYHLKLHGVDPELVRALRGQTAAQTPE